MKKLLLFFVLITMINQLFAQKTYSKAYHDINEYPNQFLVNIYGDMYFSTQSYDVPNFGQCHLYKHNGAGALVYRSTVLNYSPKTAFRSYDNKLITVGGSGICDIGFPTQTNYLTKLDTNASVVFTSTYTVKSNDNPKAALQASDSSYFSFTDSLLIIHSKTGQFISKTNLNVGSISSALLLQNNTVLLSGISGGVASLLILSAPPFPVIVMNYTVPTLFAKLAFYGGQKIIGLGTDGKLYKFSPNFNLLNQSSFSGGLFISDFVCSKDTIYSLASSPSAWANYSVVDTSFNSISLTTTTTHSLSQSAICVNSNQTAILSSGISKTSASFLQHYFTSINVINKQASNNFINDLALVSVQSDSAYTSCFFTSLPSPGENHCTSFLRPKFKVKNKGAFVITQFKLNCFDHEDLACGAAFYQELFSGLSLQPGDSIILTATKFARKGYAYDGNGTTFPVQYCFYTTLPNGETDKALEDNESCNSLNFLITGLKDYSKEEIGLKVSPNPFENSLTVESDIVIKNMEVMNSLGMLVEKSSVNDKQYTFSNSELSPGIYFIKIETEKGIATKKIIKQ